VVGAPGGSPGLPQQVVLVWAAAATALAGAADAAALLLRLLLRQWVLLSSEPARHVRDATNQTVVDHAAARDKTRHGAPSD
jgi:hypothetical protein